MDGIGELLGAGVAIFVALFLGILNRAKPSPPAALPGPKSAIEAAADLALAHEAHSMLKTILATVRRIEGWHIDGEPNPVVARELRQLSQAVDDLKGKVDELARRSA